MSKFTFLSEEDIWGDEALPMFKDIGVTCGQTDLSIILGSYVHHDDKCAWWTASMYDDQVRCVFADGRKIWEGANESFITARPYSSFSEIKQISNGKSGKEYEKYIEYYAGEYPQSKVDKNLAEKLDNMMTSGLLKQTGKSYTFDSRKMNERSNEFTPRDCPEYIYNGEKYICLDALAYGAYNTTRLKNNEKIEVGKKYWVKVEPIKWLVDKETQVAISEKGLFSGVQFDNSYSLNYFKSFSKSNMARYLARHFSEDIIPSRDKQKEDREF